MNCGSLSDTMFIGILQIWTTWSIKSRTNLNVERKLGKMSHKMWNTVNNGEDDCFTMRIWDLETSGEIQIYVWPGATGDGHGEALWEGLLVVQATIYSRESRSRERHLSIVLVSSWRIRCRPIFCGSSTQWTAVLSIHASTSVPRLA